MGSLTGSRYIYCMFVLSVHVVCFGFLDTCQIYILLTIMLFQGVVEAATAAAAATVVVTATTVAAADTVVVVVVDTVVVVVHMVEAMAAATVVEVVMAEVEATVEDGSNLTERIYHLRNRQFHRVTRLFIDTAHRHEDCCSDCDKF